MGDALMVMPRDDARFTENAALAFAMYADEASLTLSEGTLLAERVAEAVRESADAQRAYLPLALLDGET